LEKSKIAPPLGKTILKAMGDAAACQFWKDSIYIQQAKAGITNGLCRLTSRVTRSKGTSNKLWWT